jgi:SAM-dependent methyltransferase
MTLATLGAVTEVATERTDREISVIGVSDHPTVENALGRLFGDSYRNHQLHTEPFLDLVALRGDQSGIADVITCSDVLEHVPNPVSRAFSGMLELLRPGGVAVMSVPHVMGAGDEHVEHFAVLDRTRIEEIDGEPTYIGLDENGTERRFTGLTFHGGNGDVLEYRLFSTGSVQAHLEEAGFSNIRCLRRNFEQFGTAWQDWSRVWMATKPLT